MSDAAIALALREKNSCPSVLGSLLENTELRVRAFAVELVLNKLSQQQKCTVR